MPWSFGTAVEPGRTNGDAKPCQDVAAGRVLVDGSGQPLGLALSVADGAGSAQYGGEGARLAADGFVEKVAQATLQGETVNRHMLCNLIADVRGSILEHAATYDHPAYQYASTLVTAVTLWNETFYTLVGDGTAVCSMDGRLLAPVWPDEMEHLNTPTFLIAENLNEVLKVRRLAGRVEHIFLMTDGLQYIVVESKSQRPQASFFNLAFGELAHKVDGESAFINEWLSGLLKSEHIQSRTNDDTSIAYGHFWEDREDG